MESIDGSTLEHRLGSLEDALQKTLTSLASLETRVNALPMSNMCADAENLHSKIAIIEALGRLARDEAREFEHTMEQRLATAEQHLSSLDSKFSGLKQNVQTEYSISPSNQQGYEFPASQAPPLKEVIPVDSSRSADADQNKEAPSEREASVTNAPHLTTSSILNHGEKRTYKFDESVWEITLVLGTRAFEFSCVENVAAASVLFFSVFMLSCIICILFVLFSEPPDLDAEKVYAWRTHAGHNAKYADNQGYSMVTRFCKDDFGVVELSGAQLLQFNDVSEYLGEFFLSMQIGAVTCCWAIILWCLSMWMEFREILCWTCSVIALHGKETVIATTATGFVIDSCSRIRIVFVVVFSLIRGILVLGIFLTGTWWLVLTQSVTEIILNAAALAYILELDNILYQLCCPQRTQELFANLEPLALPSALIGRAYMPTNLGSTFICVGVYFLLAFFLLVVPEVERLEDIYHAYCGDNQSFILARNPATGLFYSYAYPEPHSFHDQTWMQKIASQHLKDSTHSEYQIPSNSLVDFNYYSSASFKDTVRHLGTCEDFPPESKFFIPPLQSLLNRSTIQSCSDIQSTHCAYFPIVNLACPIKCDCRAFISGNVLLEGCPMAQCVESSKVENRSTSRRQFDIERDFLVSLPEWQLYWSNYRAMMNYNLALHTVRGRPDDIASKFMELGCEAIKYFQEENDDDSIRDFLCRTRTEMLGLVDDLIFRPVRPFCPESCKCANRRRYTVGHFCPPRYDEDAYMTCAGFRVVGGGSAVESSACKQPLKSGSGPAGWYNCFPFRYNGKHLYQYKDEEGTAWAIRWETAANFDHGASLLGTGIGLQGQSKWTLVSMEHEKTVLIDDDSDENKYALLTSKVRPTNGYNLIVARFFSDGNAAEAYPPQNGWFARTAENSDITCASGSITLEEAGEYVVGSFFANSCPQGYSTIITAQVCGKAAFAMGTIDEDEITDIDEKDYDDHPSGCYQTFNRRRRKAYLNTASPGQGHKDSQLICMLSS